MVYMSTIVDAIGFPTVLKLQLVQTMAQGLRLDRCASPNDNRNYVWECSLLDPFLQLGH